ncbi:hypothetical protein DPMN_143824 [Dreissena polymorpha]|uniref:Uncharacterized protein n=1 Tax=Dreissena polymorpha TaxID=45954 RepID=A0A9D4JPN5_DREPO|nr:hypothetical protein DPMN_143824 [Dreissena polymorpha]
MFQEANIKKLMIQIGAHDTNINELRKELNKKDNAIRVMYQNQKQQDEKLNELQQVMSIISDFPPSL